jgi:hypothetical protein
MTEVSDKVVGKIKTDILLKQNTRLDATINRKIYCFVVPTLLNMCRALLCPSSEARQMPETC